jgi:MPBQ/MSBQ methyltransferase
MDTDTFADRYDRVIAEPRMRKLYGESGYFNVGYWVDGATDLVGACNRLVDELAAAVSMEATVILDAGCGLGAGTRRLAERFPQALVLGVNLSLWQLTAARSRGVEALAVMDASRMAVAGGTADAVLAIESAQHFDTRAAFVAEAHRVLRPGGVLATADMLFRDADAIGGWMVPRENRITTTAEYSKVLADAGFTDVTVRDITSASWRPYCAALRKVFQGQESARQTIEDSLARYVIAFARRSPDQMRSSVRQGRAGHLEIGSTIA